MSDLADMSRLLSEIAELMRGGTKADRRHAVEKLNQLANIATTLGFTMRPQR